MMPAKVCERTSILHDVFQKKFNYLEDSNPSLGRKFVYMHR